MWLLSHKHWSIEYFVLVKILNYTEMHCSTQEYELYRLCVQARRQTFMKGGSKRSAGAWRPRILNILIFISFARACSPSDLARLTTGR